MTKEEFELTLLLLDWAKVNKYTNTYQLGLAHIYILEKGTKILFDEDPKDIEEKCHTFYNYQLCINYLNKIYEF